MRSFKMLVPIGLCVARFAALWTDPRFHCTMFQEFVVSPFCSGRKLGEFLVAPRKSTDVRLKVIEDVSSIDCEGSPYIRWEYSETLTSTPLDFVYLKGNGMGFQCLPLSGSEELVSILVHPQRCSIYKTCERGRLLFGMGHLFPNLNHETLSMVEKPSKDRLYSLPMDPPPPPYWHHFWQAESHFPSYLGVFVN